MILRRASGLFSHKGEALDYSSHDSQAQTAYPVIWVFWTLTTITLALRMFCKIKRDRGLWWDDYILQAAWVVLTASVTTITCAVAKGLGSHTWDIGDHGRMFSVLMLSRVSMTLLIVGMAWSKSSFAFTLLRITGTGHKLRPWLVAIIASINVLLMVGAICIWAQCKPLAKVWNRHIPGSCWSADVTIVLGMATGIFSGIMDIVLAIMPWPLIWGLFMRKREKFGIAVAMSMGIFAGATAFVKVAEIPRVEGDDFTFNFAPLLIWSVIEVATTMIAASIPMLRVLFAKNNHSSSPQEQQEQSAYVFDEHGRRIPVMIDTEEGQETREEERPHVCKRVMRTVVARLPGKRYAQSLRSDDGVGEGSRAA